MIENQGTSTDQPLNHAWNYSSINGIGQCLNFSTYMLGKTAKKKKGAKMLQMN